MKKFFLSLVAAMMTATVSFAQNTLVATLSHGEDISVYYGVNALKNAYNHAVTGDVINLSEGSFEPVNITKGISIRGARASATKINNAFNIEISQDDVNRFSMDGIGCNGSVVMKGTFSNPYFMKCSFSSGISSSGTINNALLVNCYVAGGYRAYSLSATSTVQFINCFVRGLSNSNTSGEKMNASFINCLLYRAYNGGYFEDFNSSYFLNCVFYNYDTYNSAQIKLKSTNLAEYCVAVGCSGLFSDIQNGSYMNWTTTAQDFFKSTYIYELTDEAKTRYLGDDGTEVGLYGGMMPYNLTPLYPRITKMNVAKRTTNDGKLSVDIEVSAAE